MPQLTNHKRPTQTTVKIAFLLESFDLSRGGAENATLDMACSLTSLDQQVAIFAPADRCSPASAAPQNVSIHPIPIPRKAWRLGQPAYRAWELANALPRAAEKLNETNRIACGKILNSEFYWPHGGVHRAAREASLRAGRQPILANIASIARKLRPIEAVFDRIEDSVFENARNGIGQPIAISRFVQSDMQLIHGIQNPPLCPNGAPLRRILPTLSRQQARQQLAKEWSLNSEHEQWLLFVATNPRLKGAARIRSALPFLPHSTRILWVGSPKLRAHDPRERVLGLRTDIPNLLLAADALLLPTHYDPCSLISLEAASIGCPIITSEKNGALDLLNNAALVLQEPDLSGPAFADAISNLLHSQNDLQKIKEHAQLAAQNYTSLHAAKQLLIAMGHKAP